MNKLSDILVVENSASIANSVSPILKKKSLRITSLNNNKRVIKFLDTKKPALVIIDVTPGLDGISFCNLIKNQKALEKTRIIMLSSKPFEADQEKAYEAGVEAFIIKNTSLEAIGDQIIKLLMTKIAVKFWGTRGSIPTPGPRTVKYGGNTPCVSVTFAEDKRIILDAGSGIRELGNHLIKTQKKIMSHIFLTHFHWDHIQGLPFFAPAFSADNRFSIYGCENQKTKLSKILSDQMESSYFPVPLKKLRAIIAFKTLTEGSYSIEGLTVKALYLNHPGNTLGYLITHRNKTIGYLTDNEFTSGSIKKPKSNLTSCNDHNLKIIHAIQGSDLVIFDAQYTPEEYHDKKGWGHSHYKNVLNVAMAAEIKKCVLFHHDPSHADADLDKIGIQCLEIIKRQGGSMDCIVAQEGLEIEL
jgi:phosphoribosyl 1,2-cyclic phosphodiesterase/CheY-like chemotaxis protein